MPKTIMLQTIREVAEKLTSGATLTLYTGIAVSLQGMEMKITEDGREVFKFTRLLIENKALVMDYPVTPKEERGRGWGSVGLLLALYWARAKGCKKCGYQTELEMTTEAIRFWGGIQKGSKTDLELAIKQQLQKVQDRKVPPTSKSARLFKPFDDDIVTKVVGIDIQDKKAQTPEIPTMTTTTTSSASGKPLVFRLKGG